MLDQKEALVLYKKLVDELKANQGGEEGHVDADTALAEFITAVMQDSQVEEAYNEIPHMWYA